MQRSPGRRSWTGPLERPWESWITSFLIASLVKRFNARVGVSFDELIGTGHQMPRASDRPRDLKKNTKTWRLLLPQSQITVACSDAESNSSDPVVHLRFVTVIKSLCYFDDLFCFFAACYKILFTKLSFFLNFEILVQAEGVTCTTDLREWRTKDNEHGTHIRPTLTTMTLVGFGCWSKSERMS